MTLKLDWNRKYTTIAAYVVITALILMTLGAIFVNFDGVKNFISTFNAIMSPFYIGLIIAYIANPIMKLAEKYIFRFKVTSSKRFKLKRGLSIFVALTVLLIAVTILFLLIIPQVILSITDLVSKMEGYIKDTVAWLDEFLPDTIFNPAELTLENFYHSLLNYFSTSEFGEELYDISAQLDVISNNLDTLIQNSFTILKDYVPVVIGAFAGVANGVFNLILGVFFSIYVLASKEKLGAQFKKTIRAFTSERGYNSILEFGNYADKTFGSYLFGKVIDSLVVGVVIFIAFLIFGIPYAPLLSVFIAITNIIPIIGPFIGAIPGVLIIFIVDPSKVLWFIIINVIVQQIDGNIIVPKILGETTGLSSLWVLFSITVMGGLWGLMGMFVSVPIFALLYMLFKLFVEKRLRSSSLPTETEEYYAETEIRNFTEHDDNKHSFATLIKRTSENISTKTLGGKLKGKMKKKEKASTDTTEKESTTNKDN